MQPLNLLSLSHFLSTLICILVIIYLPRYFITSTESKKNIFKLALLFLVIINDGFDFYHYICVIFLLIAYWHIYLLR